MDYQEYCKIVVSKEVCLHLRDPAPLVEKVLKGLFHPPSLARVFSWFAFVVAIFMAHENGDKQRPTKRRQVQGMLDETDPSNGAITVPLKG